MHTIKTFFTRIKRSVSDPKFYKELQKPKAPSGWGYLYALLVLATFVTSIPAMIGLAMIAPVAGRVVQEGASQIRDLYPAELEMTIENGELSTNVEEPYVIEFPEEWRDDDVQERFKHIATIDTSADVDSYADTESVVLLTEEALVFPDGNTGVRVFFWDELMEDAKEPVIINRLLVDELFANVSPFIALIPTFLWTGVVLLVLVWPFIGGGFWLLGTIIYLLITTLLLWALFAIRKQPYDYKEIYRLSLFGVTMAILIRTLLSIVSFGLPVPLVPTVAFLVWMGYVLWKPRKTK